MMPPLNTRMQSDSPIANEMFRLTEYLYLCAVDFWDRFGETGENNSMCWGLSTLSSEWAEAGLIVERSAPWGKVFNDE